MYQRMMKPVQWMKGYMEYIDAYDPIISKYLLTGASLFVYILLYRTQLLQSGR